jgi:predicted nuclease with TOPRIM domain
MEKIRDILSVLGFITILILFYILLKPKETSELDSLHKQNDSLLKEIKIVNSKLDTLRLVNSKLDSQQILLKVELSKISDKSDKLKKEYEENIKYINSLSNDNLAKFFTDKFSDTE